MQSRGKSSWVSSSFDDFLVCAKSASIAHSSDKTRKVCGTALSDELWVNKYSPSCSDDLAVNKKKVCELREWIEKSLLRCKSRCGAAPILLLTGPSGVGKSVTVRLVAADLKVEVKEWTNQTVDQYTAASSEIRNNSDIDIDAHESQTSKFSSFLFRANRYPCLNVTDGGSVNQQHIVLVEEIPNVFTRSATSLHDLLRRYRAYSLSPLVFVLTDRSGTSSDYVLFPKSFQAELSIDTISLNPVAPTMLMKVLTKITSSESTKGVIRMPDKDTLELFVDSNRGDVRATINALQFYCSNISPGLSSQSNVQNRAGGKAARRKLPADKVSKAIDKKKSKERQETAGVGRVDDTLSLFHAIGKILHCKRDPSVTDQLPTHLDTHQRCQLLVDPEEVSSKVSIGSDHFVAFLHQNYVDFHTDLNEVVSAASYLSDSDELMSYWVSRSVMADYGLSVATRGLLFNTPNAPTTSVGWRPLVKAQCFDVAKLAQNNYATARDLFSLYALSPVELHTQLLPYLAACAKMQPLTTAQTDFVRDVVRLSARHLSSKSRPERLGENDFIDDEADDTREPGVSMFAVINQSENSVSETKLPLNTELLDGDDLTIEEFDD